MPKPPIEMMLDGVDWKPTGMTKSDDPSTDLYATHEGVFKVSDFEFHCYQLSDGRRVIDADDINDFFLG